MGWWKVNDKINVEVGDVVLDETRYFLHKILKEYQQDLNRKPTLEELQYILSLGLSVNANSDILANFDELRIQKILIKTEQRNKRIKPDIGDIFSFKIKENLYGFGRLVFKLRSGTIAEIFNYTSAQPIFDYSKENSWLIHPILINDFILLDEKQEGTWDIIAKNPAFKLDIKFDEVFFHWKDYQNNYKLEGVAKQGYIVNEEIAKKYPRYVTLGDEKIRAMITSALEI